MPLLGTVLVVAFLAIVFPLRWRWWSRSHRVLPRRARSQRPRPRAWVAADVLFVLGFGLLICGPAAEAAGIAPALAEPGAWVTLSGVVTLLAATGVAVWAQEAMDAAWVADIAPREGSRRLITAGPFRFVRNPNYVAMLAAGSGVVMLAFDAIAVLGWLVLLTSLLMTARAEEPALRKHFGSSYDDYAAVTGRFIPGVGRLR